MARKKEPTAIAYRVAKHSCWHRGVEYKVGDILPPMSVPELNVHLVNVELVEVPAEPEAEPAVEVEAKAMQDEFDREVLQAFGISGRKPNV